MRTDAAEILNAAIPVLVRDQAAAMRVIAEHVGISRATLVRIFPTRRHLVRAMAEKILDACDRALSRAETDPSSADSALAELITEYVPFAQLWNLVHVEPDVLGVPEASTQADAIFDRTARLFKRGQGAGLLREDMPAAWLASTFYGLAETAWELTLEGDMGSRQAPTFITSILLRGTAV